MSLKDYFQFFDYVPPNVRKIVCGGVVLGLFVMLFVKVIDATYDLSPTKMTLAAVGATVVFALLLCSGKASVWQKTVNFAASSIVIFGVGLTSNKVMVDIWHTFDTSSASQPSGNEAPPAPVPPLSDIVGPSQ